MRAVHASAAVAAGSAAGIRAWLAARSPRWMTPGRLKAITGALLVGALLASGISIG